MRPELPIDDSRPWIAVVLRRERERHGWTQQDLADRLGVSQPEIARWESGRVKQISYRNLERLADAGLDRSALGLGGFSLEKVGLDIGAAANEGLRLGRPLAAYKLLQPAWWWMEALQHRATQTGRRLGQPELTLLADARQSVAILISLAADKRRQSAAIPMLERAEQAAHQIRDESARQDRLSQIMIQLGNQSRKAGNHGDAVFHLGRAEVLALQGQYHRRSAEAAGLLAYAHGHLGEKSQALEAVDRAERRLRDLPSAGSDLPIELSSQAEPEEGSVFGVDALPEIRIRTALLTSPRHILLNRYRDEVLPPGGSDNWRLYFYVTNATALLSTKHPDALEWVDRARRLAARMGAIAQLERLLPFLEGANAESVVALAEDVRHDIRGASSGLPTEL